MSKIIAFPIKPYSLSLPVRGTVHLACRLPSIDLIEESFFITEEELRYLCALDYLNRLMDDLATIADPI
ncbi:MAG: hypothetical protein AB7S81_08845 [Bdellovibrionales bacterium]